MQWKHALHLCIDIIDKVNIVSNLGGLGGGGGGAYLPAIQAITTGLNLQPLDWYLNPGLLCAFTTTCTCMLTSVQTRAVSALYPNLNNVI